MKNRRLLNATRLGCLAVWLAWATTGQSAPLLNFPFNEGTGYITADTASGLVGYLGAPLFPGVDTVTLIDASPSGLPGDRSITNSGGGFLIADDSAQRVLDITNGPITMEAWVFIDSSAPVKAAEGIVSYGGSYKLGLKGSRQVFTLYGKGDITNTTAFVGTDRWVHLAAAWEPGQGVHFYLEGVYTFVANTNTTARPLQNPYLSIGSEGLINNVWSANNIVAALDRVRIHHALLPAGDLDSDAADPNAPLASTIVAYNFNEAALPCLNALSPSLPAEYPNDLLSPVHSPLWTNDAPSGLPGDYALAFVRDDAPQREYVNVPYGNTPIDLGVNGTNYTLQAWVKLPTEPFAARRVIYRTAGTYPRASLSINVNRTLHTTLLGVQDFTSSVVVPNDNRWHHVAAVMEDFARVHFYLDGVLRQTVDKTDPRFPSSSGVNSLLIGKESESLFFRGLLDRVVIHNTALTEGELDFPAIPGLAVVTAQPVDTVGDASGNASFTAAVSSPTSATYQWFFRTNRADPVGVSVPGATSTTLNLSGLTAANEGFYYLRITNAVGVSESYGAGLMVNSGPFLDVNGFELPRYRSGALNDQNFWVTEANYNMARVLTATEISAALTAVGLDPNQPVHGGAQAVVFSGTGSTAVSLRPVVGFETEPKVTLDVWVRPLVAGNTTMLTNNTFLTIEDSTAPTPIRAAAFRFGPALSIDYNSNNAWVPTGQLWDSTGSTWYRITMVLDYTTRTYDFLINGAKINASPIPFYFNTSESFRQIRVYRAPNQAGMIMDDLTVTATPTAPELGIRKDGASVVIFWPASVTGYVLKSANDVNAAPETWSTVSHITVGDEHQAVVTPAANSQFFQLVK
jgi:hypothetical protein